MTAPSPPLMPGRTSKLSVKQMGSSLLRIIVSMTVVLVAYFLLPIRVDNSGASFLLLVLSLAAFTAVLAWEVRRILRSNRPVQAGLEGLAFTATLFLCLFALQYMVQEQLFPGSFSEPIDKFSSLYYAVVTFGTVGFGDITPVTITARAITMVQIAGDLVFIGAGVKVLTMAAREGAMRRQHSAEATS